jgi:hypothetical protein
VIEDLAPKISHTLQNVTLQGISLGKYTLFIYATSIIAKAFLGDSAENGLKRYGAEISNSLSANANLQFQAGSDSFADHVYEYLVGKIEDWASCARQQKTKQQRHFSFIYHPGTDWHPRFKEIIREEMNNTQLGLLKGVSNDLDTICVRMREIRSELGPGPMFHVLVPANQTILISECLRIPDDLFPLQIEGEISAKGEPYYWVNFPNPRSDLLLNVGNLAPGLIQKHEDKADGREAAVVMSTLLSNAGILYGTVLLIPILGPIPACLLAQGGSLISHIGGIAAVKHFAESETLDIKSRLLASHGKPE